MSTRAPELAGADAAPRPESSGPGSRPLGRRMYRWTRKVHMYAGLLVFIHLTIYGIAGLNTTIDPAPAERKPFPSTLHTLAYVRPPGATDREVADAVHALVAPVLAPTVPDWALRRDAEGRLLINFYTVNGPTRVTVLEAEGLLRVEEVRNSFRRFLSALHAYTLRDRSVDWRTTAWAWWNELGIWSLIFLAVTGLYLWLSTRPRLALALASSAAGLAAFGVLWIVIR